MKKFLIGVLGIIVVGGALWYFAVRRNSPVIQRAEERTEGQIEDAMDSASVGVEKAIQTVDAKMEELELKAEDVREEMVKQGKIIRSKTGDLGEAVVDAAVDTRTTALIKSKLVADPDLSALRISVSTTAGRVTLSGTVASPELIGKAIVLALDTEGVREVISTIQVDK
jgi:osmotically-inducible protein OsmY